LLDGSRGTPSLGTRLSISNCRGTVKEFGIPWAKCWIPPKGKAFLQGKNIARLILEDSKCWFSGYSFFRECALRAQVVLLSWSQSLVMENSGWMIHHDFF